MQEEGLIGSTLFQGLYLSRELLIVELLHSCFRGNLVVEEITLFKQLGHVGEDTSCMIGEHSFPNCGLQ